MKNYIVICIAVIAAAVVLYGCCRKKDGAACKENSSSPSWQARLQEMLPLLGHRNWIVIADMAYPLQSGEGVVTLYADEPYLDVLKTVHSMIGEAPHVFAHVYRDKELNYISEDLVPGIDTLKKGIEAVCSPEAQSIMHEELIKRLDEAGKLYTVVIIKTPMTVPYTTAFFELDCAYWGSEKQKALDGKMGL